MTKDIAIPAGATRTNGSQGKEPVGAKPNGTSVSARKLDALLDILPVGVFTIGPDMRIRFLNGEAARLTGIDPRTAVGRTCEELMKCSFCSPLCAAKETQQCGEVRREFAVDAHRADGSPMSVLIDAAPLGDGDVAVAIRDVTETERMRRTLEERWVFHGLVGVSSPMKDVVGQVRDMAAYDSPVLILGERGTGKDLVARAIHAESPRADKPFVTVDASAYSENLLESELFGHARGAFAGADRDRAGRFEQAEGGTVFLDELGEVSPKIQARLLRVLQERQVERVGDDRPRPVDARLVVATDRDLVREVREGRFREDLYYRLNSFTVRLPPLRDRKEDMPALVDHLLRRVCLRTGRDAPKISDDAMDRLLAHAWPRNVRELEDALESAVSKCQEGVVHGADLPSSLTGGASAQGPGADERMRSALHRAAGSVTLAARLLGVHRTTLWRWMCEAGLKREEFMPR